MSIMYVRCEVLGHKCMPLTSAYSFPAQSATTSTQVTLASGFKSPCRTPTICACCDAVGPAADAVDARDADSELERRQMFATDCLVFGWLGP
jgi:hypothetical protein